MTSEKRNNGYKSTLKSSDTEETFDLIFYRPIGYCWALIAEKLRITPNMITIAAIILGIASAVCFYFDDLWLNIAGVFLLVWANSFDSADGQLARMTGQHSRLGRILDGLCGEIWFTAIYAAICLRENHTGGFFPQYPLLIWIFAAFTGLCHGIQVAMADYYRQFHLFFLKGKDGSELENGAHLRQEYKKMSWSKDSFSKLTMFFYIRYTEDQERRTPRMQKLRARLKELYPGKLPEAIREKFRKESLPLMKYTNILTFNVRSFALFVAVLIFKIPWLYFAFEVTVLNVILIYMVSRHEKICKDFVSEMAENKNHEI